MQISNSYKKAIIIIQDLIFPFDNIQKSTISCFKTYLYCAKIELKRYEGFLIATFQYVFQFYLYKIPFIYLNIIFLLEVHIYKLYFSFKKYLYAASILLYFFFSFFISESYLYKNKYFPIINPKSKGKKLKIVF